MWKSEELKERKKERERENERERDRKKGESYNRELKSSNLKCMMCMYCICILYSCKGGTEK